MFGFVTQGTPGASLEEVDGKQAEFFLMNEK